MKIIPPRIPTGPKTPGYTGRERQIKAAIEKHFSRYIKLNCGHFTTPQEVEMWSCWCPDPKLSYCDKCDEWVERHKYTAAIIPDDPPY